MALTKVQTIGIETGITFTGITTTSSLQATTINVSGIATFGGNVSIAGTLTYEDVTDVDSVGLITARSGVNITDGGLVVTGVTTVSAGTASVPSISFTSDPNTGLYSPGADQLALATGGSGRLIIDSNGDLNVQGEASGSPFPERKLKWSNDSTTANGFYISQGTNRHGKIWHEQGLDIEFGTSNTERLRLTYDGKLGLGESAPESILHLKGSSATLKIESSVNTGYSGVEFDRAADDTHFAIYAYDSSHATQANNVQFYGYQNGRLDFHTNSSASPRLSIASGGNVGIGNTDPGTLLTVGGSSANGSIFLRSGSNNVVQIYGVSPGGAYSEIDSQTEMLLRTEAGAMRFSTVNTERARIDSSGRLLVGTSSAFDQSSGLQINGGATGYSANFYTFGADNGIIAIGSARGTVGSPTTLSSADTIGTIQFRGHDGTSFKTGASIVAAIDGITPGSDLPSRLVFSTTADSASSPTERMRIDSLGSAHLGRTNNTTTSIGISLEGAYGVIGATSNTTRCLDLNRQGDDGYLVRFLQAGTEEGNISVSGTTVSYNGAHLSRWSQLPGGAVREEILRGTVLSNIDEMCDWGDEENEQLNRMKVSDVEGDKNVSGVFQAWDDDDDTYVDDFYCAMTGDFIIRIAQGVTVERGDLLMSAGDGTAKPQDDDIIRSKTIAKVTSTHVTCTYDDGSYCVPCVLMAC